MDNLCNDRENAIEICCFVNNMPISSSAMAESHGRLRIRHHNTFSPYLMVETLNHKIWWKVLWFETLQAEICRSRRFWKGWITLSANFRRKGHRPPTTVGVRKLEWLPFRAVSKYPQCIVWFCHKARGWKTYRQTDRRTDEWTDRITTANAALAQLLAR